MGAKHRTQGISGRRRVLGGALGGAPGENLKVLGGGGAAGCSEGLPSAPPSLNILVGNPRVWQLPLPPRPAPTRLPRGTRGALWIWSAASERSFGAQLWSAALEPIAGEPVTRPCQVASRISRREPGLCLAYAVCRVRWGRRASRGPGKRRFPDSGSWRDRSWRRWLLRKHSEIQLRI